MWYHDVTIHGQREPINKSPKSQDYQIISWNRCNECYQRLTLECNFFHELVRSMCSVFDDCQNRRMERIPQNTLGWKSPNLLVTWVASIYLQTPLVYHLTSYVAMKKFLRRQKPVFLKTNNFERKRTSCLLHVIPSYFCSQEHKSIWGTQHSSYIKFCSLSFEWHKKPQIMACLASFCLLSTVQSVCLGT